MIVSPQRVRWGLVFGLVAAIGFFAPSAWAAQPRSGSAHADTDQSERELARAVALAAKGKLDDAQAVCQRVVKQSPENQAAWHRLAVIQAQAGNLDGADESFRRALKLGRASAQLLADIGFYYYLDDEPKLAEKFLRASLERDPESERVHNNLAIVLCAQGRLEDAHTEFSHSLDSAQAYVSVATVCEELGRHDDAEQMYLSALAVDNSHIEAQKGLGRLEALAMKRPSTEEAEESEQVAAQDSEDGEEEEPSPVRRPARVAPRDRLASPPPAADLEIPVHNRHTSTATEELVETDSLESTLEEAPVHGGEDDSIAQGEDSGDDSSDESSSGVKRIRVVVNEDSTETSELATNDESESESDSAYDYDTQDLHGGSPLARLIMPPDVNEPRKGSGKPTQGDDDSTVDESDEWGVAYASDETHDFNDVEAVVVSDLQRKRR